MAKEANKRENGFWYFIVYIFEWLSGIIAFFTAGKQDKRMRFHAIQAILIGIIALIFSWVLGIMSGLLSTIVSLLIWLYCLYLGYNASEGKDIVAPVVGDYAASQSGFKK
jgi:uncharacterized membrane protein